MCVYIIDLYSSSITNLLSWVKVMDGYKYLQETWEAGDKICASDVIIPPLPALAMHD